MVFPSNMQVISVKNETQNLIVITDTSLSHVSDSDDYSREYGIKDSGEVKELERELPHLVARMKIRIKRIFTVII